MPIPIILELPDWVKQHLQLVYQAKTEKDFDTAFDAFISQHATITVNGEELSRSQYKKQLWNEQTSKVSATVDIKDIVAVPKRSNGEVQVGPPFLGLWRELQLTCRLYRSGMLVCSMWPTSITG
jgi:hypothetical protein